MTRGELEIMNIGGYSLAASYCRKSVSHGGVCILTRNSFTPVCSLDFDEYCQDLECEFAAIKYGVSVEFKIPASWCNGSANRKKSEDTIRSKKTKRRATFLCG